MESAILDALPPLSRLALAYAPASARADWLTVLALDARLAGVVRQAREPVIAQIRLAWWRERLEQEPAERPKGEPLFARLAHWRDGGRALAALSEGWEALLSEPPLSAAAIERFVQGRQCAMAELAALHSASGEAAERAARRWALADLVCHLDQDDEKAAATAILAVLPGARVPGRAMRPLLVLERVTSRAASKADARALTSPMALLIALRAGLLGR